MPEVQSRLLAALAVAAISLALPPVAAAKPKAGAAAAITVDARPILAFDKAAPARRTFGRLEWRGGLVLTSPSSAFGGWSALALDAGGRRLLAISDTGVWMTGELRYEAGRPAAIADARLGPLTNPDGTPLTHNDDDSEGLALVSGDLSKGEILVSFERNHRISRYPVSHDGVGPPTGFLALPPEAAQLEWNRSLESVCAVKAGPLKGSVVTLAERFPTDDDTHVGWLLAPAGGPWRTLRLTKIDGFDLTDCAGLADGGILVLERRYRLRDLFEGPKMRLRRFSAAELASDAAVPGEVLVEAGPGQEVDNMEGLAVHQGDHGETVVTLISDNNFNHIAQRTVLLQFALPAPAPPRP